MTDAHSHHRLDGILDNDVFLRPEEGDTLVCDVLIAGGSTAAYAAALVTAHAGLQVYLVQPQHIVGGQFTAQALPASDDGDLLRQKSIAQLNGEEFAISRMQRTFRDRQRQLQPVNGRVVSNPGGGWVAPLCTTPVVAARAMNEAIAPYIAPGNLTLIPFSQPIQILTKDEPQRQRVTGVVFQDLQRNVQFTVIAKVTLEATDLGDLLELGNIASRVGQEGRDDTGEAILPEKPLSAAQQAFTFGAVMELASPGEGVPIGEPVGYNQQPWLKADEFEDSFWRQGREGWEPQPRPFLHPFSIFRYRRILRSADAEKIILPGDVTVLNWGLQQHGPNGRMQCGNNYRSGELVGVSREERLLHLNRARDRARAYVHFLQTRGHPLKLRGDLTWTPDGIALEPYIREARRGVALTTIRHEDVARTFFPNQARARCFGDSVGIGQYHYLDIHPNDEPGQVILEGDQMLTLPFSLPLGALVPINTDGLILSAKSIGTTHITNAAYRMHPMEWAIGEASGHLAVLCVQSNLALHQIAVSEAHTRRLQGMLARDGIPIFWFDDIAHDDPDFEAIQVMAAAGIVRSENTASLSFNPENDVSRAVVATALFNVLKLQTVNAQRPSFWDVPATHWAFQTIEALAARAIVSGVGRGRFAPDRPITREQMSFMVQNATPEMGDRPFKDTLRDRQLLSRRELSRVLYEVLKLRLQLREAVILEQ